MIIKSPSQGNWTEWSEQPYSDTSGNAYAPTLHDTPPKRATQLLGPDGNTLYVDIPRRALGFDLFGDKTK